MPFGAPASLSYELAAASSPPNSNGALANQWRGMMTSERRLCLVSIAISSRFGVIHTQAQRPSRVARVNHPISHQPGTAVPPTRYRNMRLASFAVAVRTEMMSARTMENSRRDRPNTIPRQSSRTCRPWSSRVADEVTGKCAIQTACRVSQTACRVRSARRGSLRRLRRVAQASTVCATPAAQKRCGLSLPTQSAVRR